MTEKEYFNTLENYTNRRDTLILKHFGNNFLQKYMDASEREWYKKNIAPLDSKILQLANEISKKFNFNKTYSKLAEVYKDPVITSWYVKFKVEKMKRLQNQNLPNKQ